MPMGVSENAPAEVQQQWFSDPRVIKAYQMLGVAPGTPLPYGQGPRLNAALLSQGITEQDYPQGYNPDPNSGLLVSEGSLWPMIIAGTAGAVTLGAASGAFAGADAGVDTLAGSEFAGDAAASTASSALPAATSAASSTLPSATTATEAASASAPSWLSRASGFVGSDTGKALIGVGGSLIGTALQTSAAKDAAALNAKYLEEALAYEKERDKYARDTEANRYGAMTAQTSPYVQTGTQANSRMASLLGLSGAPAWSPSSSGPGPAPAPSGGPSYGARMGAPGPSGPPSPVMRTMRAPDGSTNQVPADQVEHYTQRGAQLVG